MVSVTCGPTTVRTKTFSYGYVKVTKGHTQLLEFCLCCAAFTRVRRSLPWTTLPRTCRPKLTAGSQSAGTNNLEPA
jgi:hypothetical protein